MDKAITVIGGGTAGWLTAFFLAKKKNFSNITVIESSEIGILGAGEGSTPILKRTYIDDLGLDENEFISKVNGTKKYGIDFQGWNKDSSYKYIHGFELNGYANSRSYAYHFDAILFAKYLKEKSLELGVKVINKVVQDFTLVDSKIKEIIFTDTCKINTDFVFDCSGFNRLVVDKLYKSEWISFSDQLLVDSALPFTYPTKDTPQFVLTSAIASNSGWIWKIPLQNRVGCGYVFSSKYADEDSVRKEIIFNNQGKEISFGKTFKFEPGYYARVANSNSIAIGLSTGFLEPMEATSIMTSIHQLRSLPDNFIDTEFQEHHNTVVKSLYEQSMLFIRHHYNCSKRETKFWEDYKKLNIPNILFRVYSSVFNENENLEDIINPANGLLLFKKSNYKLILDQNFATKSAV